MQIKVEERVSKLIYQVGQSHTKQECGDGAGSAVVDPVYHQEPARQDGIVSVTM